MKVRYVFIGIQGILTMASALVFPYYTLFLKNVGSSYSSFGYAYGLFALSTSVVAFFLGGKIQRLHPYLLLSGYSFVVSVLFWLLPSIEDVQMVYVIQIVFGGIQVLWKVGEKVIVKDLVPEEFRYYLFWTSFCSALAIILFGTLFDSYDISLLFASVAMVYAGCGIAYLILWKKRLNHKKTSVNN